MFDVKLDKKRHVVSFEKNEKKYNDSLRLLGFVAIVTLGLDLTAPQALAHYKLSKETSISDTIHQAQSPALRCT